MGRKVGDIAIDLLGILRRSPAKYHAIPDIAAKVESRTRIVNDALRGLVVWGYRFEFDSSSRVRFVSAPDSIFPHEIDHHLKTKFIGRNIISYFSLPSTNTLAFNLATEGAPEGTIVIAEKQTEGRGRLGRGWFSPPKLGLWTSIILRPTLPPSELPSLSIVTASALAEALHASLKLDAEIKWPNDCLIDGLKVAGILTELSAELDKANFVVVGVGINVNQSARDFPPHLRGKATSLKLETGSQVNRLETLAAFLLAFEKMYVEFKKSGLRPLLPAIKKRSCLLGKNVRLKQGNKTIIAKAVDISPDGALLVKRRGEVLRVTAGEVTVI
jgi:BirA family biotin operon repressor/biotin-[acetyl-CoA-carboxylase] ligase